jgi:hypothetical protein
MHKLLAVIIAVGGLAGCAKTQIGYNPETRQFSYSSTKNVRAALTESYTSGTLTSRSVEIIGDAATVNEGTWLMVNETTGQIIPIAQTAAKAALVP